MLAKHVLAVLLSVGASAIPFDKRDASAVLADFNTLSTDLSALGSAISSFDGTLNGALGVQQKEGEVETALKQTVSDVKASTAFSAADSTSVTNAVTGLEPNIVNVLNDLVSKKSGFDSVGVTSIVVSDLNSLHDLTGQLSTELQSKVTSGDASTISAEAARLDAEYKKAIAAYS
ncbi:hydrophobic surface binding protein A-domain-containing protein [Aspergillus novoparasiticus]|uniref:Cell wall mannoprotein 1 n=1 Tax=Aspergillus novoparasiticus TaxID=986946 RepID=A0A5N6EIP8_9EURO|nr:hydrophobic surface binding protein A-domain-containing protein [Aspergillus novoparasiticus]